MSLNPAYSREADVALSKLEEGPDALLQNAVADAIDLICDHPDSAEARRRRLTDKSGRPVWSVAVRSREGWVVLWWPDGRDAYIAYIGPM